MKDQHKHIKGYRDLSVEEVEIMNYIKTKGEELGVLVARLKKQKGFDKRWLAIGETDLQTGIMALIRAVAQPTTF